MTTARRLNQAQQAAVDAEGTVLIVAGAGTGKTTVITEKIAALISRGVARPEEILALTFTDKAAQEMQERVEALIKVAYSDLSISTFHTFCERILQQYGFEIGLPTPFRVMTDTETLLMLRGELDQLTLDYYRPLGNPTKHLAELIRHFADCKDELITPEQYLAYAEGAALDQAGTFDQGESSRLSEVANLYSTYCRLLLERQSLDFGDLIAYVVRLLEMRPKFAKLLQSQYRYIFVDEFQDVNWAQSVLVRRLTGPTTSLTVVGDDDQSIYAFRGASVANILRFTEDYPQSKPVVLTENYRSDQRILDLAYQSIVHNNPDRLEVKLALNKVLRSRVDTYRDTSSVVELTASTGDDEANAVAKEIVALKAADASLTWDDFAILVRANQHADAFMGALRRAQIPYEFVAASGLLRQPVVLDVLNFLKAVQNFDDSTAIYRLLRLPCLDVSEYDLQSFTLLVKQKSVSFREGIERAAELRLSPDFVAVATRLVGTITAATREAKQAPPSALCQQFLEESGYLAYLARHSEEPEIRRQIEYLRQWQSFVENFEKTAPDAHLDAFLDYYAALMDAGDDGELTNLKETPDSVNILSIHRAKGLEWRVVFVVNLVEERFPTRRRHEGIQLPESLVHEPKAPGEGHIEEERRLFYVAMTRAKQHLYFTGAESYGGVKKRKRSRFLAELDGTEVLRRRKIELDQDAISLLKKKSGTNHLPLPPDELPTVFSFSQLRSYENCPYQYKLAHILHLPTKSNASFSFGQTIHSTLQEFYTAIRERAGQKQSSLFGEPAEAVPAIPTLKDLLDMYERRWSGDWYGSERQRQAYFAKGREILRLFYAAQDGRWTIPVALESAFKIKIGNYFLRGRIDRVNQQPDGSLEIIDYKTGKSKEKLASEDKEQLLIYQIAAEALPQYRNIGPVGKLTFFYVNDTIKTSFLGSGEELERLKQRLIEMMDNIRAGEFSPSPNSFACAHCDFRDMCDFRVM